MYDYDYNYDQSNTEQLPKSLPYINTAVDYINALDAENDLLGFVCCCNDIVSEGVLLIKRNEIPDYVATSGFFQECLDDYAILSKLKKAELVQLALPSEKNLMSLHKEDLLAYVLDNPTPLSIEYLKLWIVFIANQKYKALFPIMAKYARQRYTDYMMSKFKTMKQE